jgi:hypothetical protein
VVDEKKPYHNFAKAQIVKAYGNKFHAKDAMIYMYWYTLSIAIINKILS